MGEGQLIIRKKTLWEDGDPFSGGVMPDLYLLNLYSNMPALTFGAARWSRKGGAHMVDEYVSIEYLMTLTKVTVLTMMDWCGYEKVSRPLAG